MPRMINRPFSIVLLSTWDRVGNLLPREPKSDFLDASSRLQMENVGIRADGSSGKTFRECRHKCARIRCRHTGWSRSMSPAQVLDARKSGSLQSDPLALDRESQSS